MANNIVPGVWVSGSWCFLLYEHPEDAVFVFLKWLPTPVRSWFFKKLAHTTIVSSSVNNANNTFFHNTSYPITELAIGHPLPEVTKNVVDDVISVIAEASTSSAIAAAETKSLLAVCNDKKKSTQVKSTTGKEHLVLNSLINIWSCSIIEWQKDKASMSAIEQLACGGSVTYTICNCSMLVVDRIEILSIPLIKVLHSKNDETKTGWIMLLPFVEANLQIVDLSD